MSHAVTVPPGRGGVGALEAPQDRHGQGPQDGDLQSGTDNSEAMAELADLEAMAVQGAQEAMAVQGAQEAMAVQGAQEAMVVQGAQEAMAGGLRGPWPQSPRPGPYSRNPFTPQKKFHGAARGYQEPSGAGHITVHDMTGQDSRARQTGQDIPQEPEALLG